MKLEVCIPNNQLVLAKPVTLAVLNLDFNCIFLVKALKSCKIMTIL